MIVYNLYTFTTDTVFPFAFCIFGLSKFSGKYYRGLNDQELEKCKKGCFSFKATRNNNEKLHRFLQFKAEAKKDIIKIVKYNLYIIAHNSSGFDYYVVLNILPQKKVVSLIKNGAVIASPKIFIGYVDKNKKILILYISDVEMFILIIC